MRCLAFLLLVLLTGLTPAIAGNVVSDEASNVSITIYRDPNRGSGEMDANWPGGYALITEKRRLHIPVGDSVIRFEGVAEGMMPETAIVTGLPEGVHEKNRDARLISPAGLVDAYLRRTVHLRRTSGKTGKVTEQDAVIRAGPRGGVVIETAEGIEALGCSGLPERMTYDGVPEGLSARPTLSVLTTSAQAVDVTVELSYLAQGFDWSANYVANMGEDGRTAAVFAWLTIANGGTQSFPDARLQVVAGRPNKGEAAPLPEAYEGGLELKCWPMDGTSTFPKWEIARLADSLNRLAELCTYECDAIVVTGARVRRYEANSPLAVTSVGMDMIAKQEELGELKLYRVPIPVTVSAQGQKQVAMIDKPAVTFERIYIADENEESYRAPASKEDQERREAPREMTLTLRTRNLEANGLGLPLPAGNMAIFEPVGDESLLAGDSDLRDYATGERLDIPFGESPDVQWAVKKLRQDKKRRYWRIEVTNARPVPVHARILLSDKPDNKPKGLERDEDGWVLAAQVPANGSAVFDYEMRIRADEER